MSELSPIGGEHKHLDIGSDTFVIGPDGTPLRFQPQEKNFLAALDKTHSLELAAQAIGKSVEWAHAFFNRPKISAWSTHVAAQVAAKNGMTQHWWYAMMLAVVRGKMTWWEGECATCHVKQKTYLEPGDAKGISSAKCLGCGSDVLMNLTEQVIRLDRQQMTALQELGARIAPKIERISHEFTGETFEFTARDE